MDNNQICLALKKVFPKSKIKKNIKDLKINSLKEWDSLGNFNLLLEIEKQFNFRFKNFDYNSFHVESNGLT